MVKTFTLTKDDILKGTFHACPDTVSIPQEGINLTYKDANTLTFIVGVDRYGDLRLITSKTLVHTNLLLQYTTKYGRLDNRIEGRLWQQQNIITIWNDVSSAEMDIISKLFKQVADIDISNCTFASEFDYRHAFMTSVSEFIKMGVPSEWDENTWNRFESMSNKNNNVPKIKDNIKNKLGFSDRDYMRHFMYAEGKETIKITQQDLLEMVKSAVNLIKEDVYFNNINNKNKTANITYHKGNSEWGKKKIGGDYLKTDKMDSLDASTYKVPLKGGITSYNITSINGVAVMHYFKNYFEHKKTTVDVTTDAGSREAYEIKMQEKEFNQFKEQFFQKVNRVISYCLNSFQKENPKLNFTKVSIYPVPSSSNFNQTMANEMSGFNFAGIEGGTQVINSALFRKDLKNIQKDTDFINNNKEYYDSYVNGVDGETHGNSVETSIHKYSQRAKYLDNYIRYINHLTKNMVEILYQYRATAKKTGNTDTSEWGKKLFSPYLQYANALEELWKYSEYRDSYEGKTHNQKISSQIKKKKSSKGPSNERNTNEIYDIVKPFLRGVKTNSGKPIEKMEICQYEPNFQIKNLTNDIRMGMKNYYTADYDVAKEELEKIKNTVFVIFDDNISGGATLSDICLQAKNLGIQYIIPITFGKMREKWSKFAGSSITKPDNDFNTDFKYEN